jgi:hypothetical protein
VKPVLLRAADECGAQLWLVRGFRAPAARRFAFDAPGALLLGAVAGVGLATVLARRLPGRVAVLPVGLGVFAFATAGLHLNLT